MAGPTILKLGYTNPQTDSFGAHPALGGPLDLNDGVTFTLVSPDGLELAAPPRTLVPTGNIRTQGERVVRAVYRHNREAVVRLVVGPAATYASFAQTLRTLLAWVHSAPAQPITLQWQPPSATQPVYLDVVGGACDVSVDEGEWLRQELEPIEIVFVVRPGLRGDRQVLSNLITNPGFEQGGLFTPFSDPLASFAAYTVQAGGALAQDTLRYPDVVGADAPIAYYRLDETSGTTAYNAGSLGSGANGTTHGSPTQNVAGLLTGDTDPCYTFASASSQYVGASGAGGPTGNGAITLEAVVKFAANPASNALILTYGGTANGTGVRLWVDTAGKLNGDATSVGTITSAVALSTGTPHHVALTWDGTTLRLYADGVSVGTPTTPGALTLAASIFVGASATPGNFWSGQLDEVAIYAGALSAARITAHYNAFHVAPAATGNTLVVPSGGRISFGPASSWGSLANWQVRWRYTSGGTFTFYPHYVDANNNLQIVVTGTALTVNQLVGGTLHQVATGSVTLVNGVQYWLRMTLLAPPQAVSGESCYLGATLYADAAGTVGAALTPGGAPVGAGTFDTVTAMTGLLELAASGAPLALGGNFAGVQSVALPGPGGWLFAGAQNGATGTCWPAWEQTAAQTYSGGPVTSFGAARVDLPAGAVTVDAAWHLYAGVGASGAPAGTAAVPVAAPGDTLGYAVAVKSSGLGASATLCLVITEYDASGNPLRTSANLAPKNGNQGAWTTLSATYTTGAGCAWADVALRCVDAVAGDSAGGQVWWDNAQLWDVTHSGQTSMPYCELRFAASPAQLVVSGLLGDLVAPALAQVGTYQASWGRGAALSYALGRRGVVSAGARLVASAIGYYGGQFTPVGQAVADPTAAGGTYVRASTQNGATWNPRGFAAVVRDVAGVYHLFTRFRAADPAPGGVQVRARTDEALDAWYTDAQGLGTLGTYWGPWGNPLTGNGWTVCDVGQVILPPFPKGALADPAAIYVIPRGEWNPASGSAVELDCDWLALLPVDGSVVLGVVNNPGNSPVAAVSNSYVWVYLDGLLANRAGAGLGGPGVGMGLDGPSAGYSLEGSALPQAGHAGGGGGTQGTGAINVNGGGDPYLTLDPTLLLGGVGSAGSGGVNQLVGYVSDSGGDVLPLACELAYSPLYLWPR